MCNISPDSRQTGVLFESDCVFFLLMSLMAFTGGFLGGKAMHHASATSPLHLQDDTGNIMGTCVAVGLLFGALINLIILTLI